MVLFSQEIVLESWKEKDFYLQELMDVVSDILANSPLFFLLVAFAEKPQQAKKFAPAIEMQRGQILICHRFFISICFFFCPVFAPAINRHTVVINLLVNVTFHKCTTFTEFRKICVQTLFFMI